MDREQASKCSPICHQRLKVRKTFRFVDYHNIDKFVYSRMLIFFSCDTDEHLATESDASSEDGETLENYFEYHFWNLTKFCAMG